MKDSSDKSQYALNELKRVDLGLAKEYEISLNKRGAVQRARLILDTLDRLPATFSPELKNDLFEPVRMLITTNNREILELIKNHGRSQTELAQSELVEASPNIGRKYRDSLRSRNKDKNVSFMSSVRDAGRMNLVNEREQNNLLKAIFEQDFNEEQVAIRKNELDIKRKSKKISVRFSEDISESESDEESNKSKKQRHDRDNISDIKKAAIRIAIKKDDYRAIRHLINNGVDPNIKDKDGDSILHRAIKAKKTNITDYLMRLNSVDLDSLNDRNEASLTLLVKNFDIPNVLEHMSKILHLGKHRNIVDVDGNNSLHHLAIIWEREDGTRGRNSSELFRIKELLVQNVDNNIKNKEEQTPFEISSELKNVVSISSPLSTRNYSSVSGGKSCIEQAQSSRGSGGHGQGF